MLPLLTSPSGFCCFFTVQLFNETSVAFVILFTRIFMKKYFLHILCILLLDSCNNEQLLEEYERPVPIRFSSQCVEIATKTSGVIVGNILPQNTQISLFSLTHQPNVVATAWEPAPFNNTQGLADAQGDILYDNTYYFPSGQELDFFALHPTIGEISSAYTGEEEITFSLKENAAEQFDLIYASLLNQSKKSETLIFEFRHLLTQVSFQVVKNEGVTVNMPLTQIEVVAPQTGRLNIRTGVLTPITETTKNFILSTQTDINQTSVVAGQFLLFPSLATDFILTFGNSSDHVYHVSTTQAEEVWKPGQNYLYTITINRDILAPSVNESSSGDTSSQSISEGGNSDPSVSPVEEVVPTKSVQNNVLSLHLSPENR